jgi:hypothetical protein
MGAGGAESAIINDAGSHVRFLSKFTSINPKSAP